MKQTLLIVAGILLGIALGPAIGSARQQNQYPRPTLDTGPVRIDGTVVVRSGSVNVENTPEVFALQDGAWAVTIRPPSITVGQRYAITWPDGSSQIMRLSAAREDGWLDVEVEGPNNAGYMLLNPLQARSMRPLPAR